MNTVRGRESVLRCFVGGVVTEFGEVGSKVRC